MNSELPNNEFFKSLPKEIQDKLMCCTSDEEAMDILKEKDDVSQEM